MKRFTDLFQRSKSKSLYLAGIFVVPRTDWETMDESGWNDASAIDIEEHTRKRLNSVFELPSIPCDTELEDNDLALEIALLNVQGGVFTIFDIGPEIPVFWRPKVKIKARLFYPLTGKTKKTFQVSSKVGWLQFIYRILQPKPFFGIAPAFNERDIDLLLSQSCNELLLKIRKSI
tara:strand:+ start:807 stop:1331 length:525 start_codon:yes stop_codon:yes gene_type:complete